MQPSSARQAQPDRHPRGGVSLPHAELAAIVGPMSAANLADYVRHAEQYGGLRDCWEAARLSSAPSSWASWPLTLRRLGSRQRGSAGRAAP